MSQRRPIYRPSEADPRQLEQTREITEAAREILKQPRPDTFLGRKTQEPFPPEDEGVTLAD